MGTPAARLLTAPDARPQPGAPGFLDSGTMGKYVGPPRSVEVGQDPQRLLSSNPKRVGAYLFNAGGKLELPIDLGAGGRGQAALPLQQFVDSGSIQVPSYALSTYKALYLRVTTALAHAAAQATAQLIVGRGPWAPASGGASGAGGTAENFLKGAAQNLGGAAATTLAVGIYVLSPTDIPDLQWPHPYIGLELNFGAALTAGAAQLFLDMPLGPALFLGHSDQISPVVGAAGHAFMLGAQSPYIFVPTDRELWALAGPGGVADVRVWEVFYPEAA